jgi:hypothetical protein
VSGGSSSLSRHSGDVVYTPETDWINVDTILVE